MFLIVTNVPKMQLKLSTNVRSFLTTDTKIRKGFAYDGNGFESQKKYVIKIERLAVKGSERRPT